MPKPNVIGHVILEETRAADKLKVVADNKDKLTAEACLQEAEEENRNGRSYLTQDLTREQNCKRTKELLHTGYMLGEGGHPMDSSIIRQQTIDPGNTAVRYLKFWMDGPKWMAHFQGTNNELGRCVDADLRDGYLPAFSMRALGCLENVNGRNLVRDLKYITHDFVIFPSHPGAYTQKLVHEGAIIESNSRLDAERRRRGISTNQSSIIPIMNEQVMDYIKQESANVKTILEQVEIFYESIQYDPRAHRVTMKTKAGDLFCVNCESYIKNEIEQFCDSIF